MKPNFPNANDEINEFDQSFEPDAEIRRQLCPIFIEEYQSRGYIYNGEIIITPPIVKETIISGHKVHSYSLGFVYAMNKIFEVDDWQLQSGSYTFDLTKTSLVYKCLPYAVDEMNEASTKELGLESKNEEEWIVSKRCAEDNVDDIYQFASNLFCAAEGQQYNIFVSFSIKDTNATSFNLRYQDMGLKFLGVYAIDRKKSFIHRRRIFHKVANRMNIRK